MLGIIVGNRGFFPAHLCESGRRDILRVLEQEGIKSVTLAPDATKFGAVESLSDAQKCADLFKAHRDEIDGILVTLPNFGDERAVANTLRWANLDVPVLIHAFNDDAAKMTIRDRRDSFCGKMSVCNNLRQYGIPYSLTRLHTAAPDNPDFRADLRRFAATCNRSEEYTSELQSQFHLVCRLLLEKKKTRESDGVAETSHTVRASYRSHQFQL